MTDQEVNTKERILQTANTLFADKGFSATSVREISQLAQVNLSAINYHFKNKENLYSEVFQSNHKWLSDSITKIGSDESIKTQEFAWKVFEFFVSNGAPLLNTFKIFLNQNTELPIETLVDCKGNIGPPGHEAFIDKIKQDVGEEVTYEGLHWAMRMIFTHIVHFGICMNTPIMKNNIKSAKHLSPDSRKKSIYALVEAILEHLKNNSDWKD